jgi:Carboxypeptidase regulatory-like domain
MSLSSPPSCRAIVLLAALVVVASTLAHAQSGATVGGSLFDQVGNTIPGVFVRLYSERRMLHAESDSSGKFSFEHLESGTYTLEFIKAGFQLKTIESLEVKHGDAKTVSVTLIVAPTSGFDPNAQVSYEANTAGGASIVGVIRLDVPMAEPNVDWRSTIPPYSQATIELLKAGSDEIVASTHPDTIGNFQFTRLTVGEYVLKAKLAGYYERKSVKFRVMREELVKAMMTMTPYGEGTPLE